MTMLLKKPLATLIMLAFAAGAAADAEADEDV